MQIKNKKIDFFTGIHTYRTFELKKIESIISCLLQVPPYRIEIFNMESVRRSSRLSAKNSSMAATTHRVSSKKASTEEEINLYPRRSARLAAKVEKPTLKDVTQVSNPSRPLTETERIISQWGPISEEEYTKSYLYMLNVLDAMKNKDTNQKRLHILNFFTHLLYQPIVLAKNKKFRSLTITKFEELKDDLMNSKNIELMAMFAPTFVEVNKLLIAIPLHPSYTE